jgi:hypothetical protein
MIPTPESYAAADRLLAEVQHTPPVASHGETLAEIARAADSRARACPVVQADEFIDRWVARLLWAGAALLVAMWLV